MLTLTPDKLVRLSPDLKIGDFDCGDADLNEFLRDDAVTYLTELLSVTYLVMDKKRVAGFFSLSNDNRIILLTGASDDPGGAAQQEDHICILLDRARIPQIR